MEMSSIILKFIMSYVTDENVRKIIQPYKVQFVASIEADAKKTPQLYDDILVKFLKAILGV